MHLLTWDKELQPRKAGHTCHKLISLRIQHPLTMDPLHGRLFNPVRLPHHASPTNLQEECLFCKMTWSNGRHIASSMRRTDKHRVSWEHRLSRSRAAHSRGSSVTILAVKEGRTKVSRIEGILNSNATIIHKCTFNYFYNSIHT